MSLGNEHFQILKSVDPLLRVMKFHFAASALHELGEMCVKRVKGRREGGWVGSSH